MRRQHVCVKELILNLIPHRLLFLVGLFHSIVMKVSSGALCSLTIFFLVVHPRKPCTAPWFRNVHWSKSRRKSSRAELLCRATRLFRCLDRTEDLESCRIHHSGEIFTMEASDGNVLPPFRRCSGIPGDMLGNRVQHRACCLHCCCGFCLWSEPFRRHRIFFIAPSYVRICIMRALPYHSSRWLPVVSYTAEIHT